MAQSKGNNRGGGGGNRGGGNNKGGGNNRGGGGGNKGGGNRPPNNKGNAPKPKEQGGGGNGGNQGKPAPKASKASDTSNDLLWFAAVLFLIAGFFLFNKFYLAPRRPGIYNSNFKNPPLKQDGRLTFLDAESNQNLIGIDIEIADTPSELVAGLSNRNFLPANGGLLYVYKEAAPRTFSMKSTFLTLDILFLNANKEITRIVKNARPRSPVSIPSGGNSQYVIQVQGGFCDAFNIRVSDYIEF